MLFRDSKNSSEELLAGFEVYRTEVYGSELAKRLDFNVLLTLASNNIHAKGQKINQLKA